MRHRAKGRQLSRTASHKKALLANLATSLFRHDKIVTTEAKAKELRPYAERLITLARRGDLHARRLVERRLKDSHKTRLLYDDAVVDAIAQRCTEVESGARNVDNILTNTLLPEISRRLLEAIAEGAKPEVIRVGIGDGGAFTYWAESQLPALGALAAAPAVAG